MVESKSRDIVNTAYDLANEIEDIHKEPSFAVIASERYFIANQFAHGAQLQSDIKITFSERLDKLVTHRIFGYFISALVVGGLLLMDICCWRFLLEFTYKCIRFLPSSRSSNSVVH